MQTWGKNPNVLEVREKLGTTWKFLFDKKDQIFLQMCSNSISDFQHTWLGHYQLQSAAFCRWKSHLSKWFFLRDRHKCYLLIISSYGLNCLLPECVLSVTKEAPVQLRESSLTGFLCPFNLDAGPHRAALLTDSQVHLQILKGTLPYQPPWGHIIHFMGF